MKRLDDNLDESKSRIEHVRFKGELLVVDLTDGRSIGTPVRWYPRLQSASAQQRSNWMILGDGIGVHWPDVEEDLSLRGMIAGRAAIGISK